MWFWTAVALADPSRPAPIVNGQVEEGFSATVALAFGQFTFCTGSLITPRVVLTAAHCVDGFEDLLVSPYGGVLSGTDSLNPDHVMRVAEVRPHPGYVPLQSSFASTELPESDVAVLVLAQDAPKRIDPVWFRTDRLSPKDAEGELVTSVGYGLDENGGSGTKRSAELVVARLDGGFLVSRNERNENNANVCSGDSGGPQYHLGEDGRWTQWSVHSWADSRCAVETGSTLTDRESDWILSRVEAVHGTSDRCEIFGEYENGVCDSGCAEVDPECLLTLDEILAAGPGEPVGGCSTAPAVPLGWGLLPGLLLLRRRR